MKNNFTLFILLFWTSIFVGQTITERTIQGRISVESNFIDGVNIRNETTRQATTSRIEGYFRIPANEGDIIVFSAVNLESLTKVITKADLSNKELKIEMTLKSIVLKNITINSHPEITAEKQLQTATKGSLDGILNGISGRTAMLKKEVQVERKEKLLEKIEYLFEEEFYIQKLKIPKDYIKGFQHYCIEDQAFVNSMKTKNKTMSEFLIIKLAERYNQIISDENK